MLIYFLLVLFVIFTAVATYLAWFYSQQFERAIEAYVQNDAAWEQGLDDREEAWGAEIHDALDRIKLLEETCAAYYEINNELLDNEKELVREREAYREVGVQATMERNNFSREIERVKSVLRTIESERDALTALIQTHMAEYDELDELYGEAATELLETINEVDKIAAEVKSWVSPMGTPYD